MVQYATYASVMWKLEASSEHTLRIDFTVKQEMSCVQEFNYLIKYIYIFIDSGIFNEGEGVDIILTR